MPVNSFIKNNGNFQQTPVNQHINNNKTEFNQQKIYNFRPNLQTFNNFQQIILNQEHKFYLENSNEEKFHDNCLTSDSFLNQITEPNDGLTLTAALQQNSLPAPQILDSENLEEELSEDGTIKFDWV